MTRMPLRPIWNQDEPRRSALPATGPARAGRSKRFCGSIPQLFPHRPDRRWSGSDHLLFDLVVRHLGRWLGAALRSGGLPAGNLLAVWLARFGADRRRDYADTARFSDRQPDWTNARRSGRAATRPNAGGACDLSQPQAGVRNPFLRQGIELPPRRPG